MASQPTSDKIGATGESAVLKDLQGRGAKCRQTPGSFTTTDISAQFPDGTAWLLQVKASLGGEPAGLSSDEARGLKSRATKLQAVPVLAQVKFNQIDAQGTWWHDPVTYYNA